MSTLETEKRLLGDLVAFPSVTGKPNLDIAGYVREALAAKGIEAHLDFSPDGRQANVFATVGPKIDGGVILSGHMDVVPASADGWTTDPFRLAERDGRLYGRGAVDMKGFLALALAAAGRAATRANALKRPLHIAFTYDEEIGSFGARNLQPFLKALPFRPAIAIVGEPTTMQPIIGHKGGIELITEITGKGGHASVPYRGVNAVYAVGRLIAFLEAKAAELAARPRAGSPFEPPYTTISVGTVVGGEARNVIPRSARMLWEVRPVPEEDADALLADIDVFARSIDEDLRARDPDAGLRTIVEARYPGLLPEANAPSLKLVQRLWDGGPPQVVSFGTDGGYFQGVGISTIVFGPGNMREAHQPDEFIAVDDLAEGAKFLDRLIDALCSD
ncbi:MAG: acetylornithine deacetylase [Hyphomicrobiales bacterium]